MKTPPPFILKPPSTPTRNISKTAEFTLINSLSPIQNATVHDKSPEATSSAPQPTSAPSVIVAGTSTTNIEKSFIGPLQLRGLPKAGPRIAGRVPRRKATSIIATDTPNKDNIEKRWNEKKQKQMKATAKTKKRKVLQESSSEDENQISVYSEDEPIFEDEEDDYTTVDPNNFPALKGVPKEGDFIIVEFEVKRKRIFYAAKVIGKKGNETEVSFLRKSDKTPNNFHMPNMPDIATVALGDIKMILPKPKFSDNTKRKQCMYHFDLDFSNINLR